MWYRGVAELARGRPDRATTCFTVVYRAVAGELAPKLALGVAAECADDHAAARGWYEIVSRTDPSYTTATFGLARCCLAGDDRAGALAAYGRVPETSSAYTDAQVAAFGVLVGDDDDRPELADLAAADGMLRDLDVGAEQRSRMTMRLLEAALHSMPDGGQPTPAMKLAGRGLDERDLRSGLEQTYRDLARLAPGPGERFELVDAANDVRPRTWT